MKLLFIISIFVLTMNYSKCQTQYYGQNNNEENHEILTAQVAGHVLTGLGALTIAFTGSDIYPVENKTKWYTSGVVLVGGGICLLIFAKKDEEPKYWKGMQGYLPDKNLRNDFLIPMLECPASSNNNILPYKMIKK